MIRTDSFFLHADTLMRGRLYTGSARVAVRLAKIIDRPSNKRGRSLKQKRPTIYTV